MGLRPLEDLAKWFPERHLTEGNLPEWCPGDDHAVEVVVLNGVEILVKGLHMRDRRILTRPVVNSEQFNMGLKGTVGQHAQ